MHLHVTLWFEDLSSGTHVADLMVWLMFKIRIARLWTGSTGSEGKIINLQVT